MSKATVFSPSAPVAFLAGTSHQPKGARMRTAVIAAVTISLGLLAGCDDGRPAENVTRIKVANPHSDQLKALSPQMQRLGLMRAIRDNGRRCGRVEASAYQQEHRGLEMWVALCEDGRHWGVFIAPNGDTQIRDCAQNRQLNLPQCRPVAAPPPDPNANGV